MGNGAHYEINIRE